VRRYARLRDEGELRLSAANLHLETRVAERTADLADFTRVAAHDLASPLRTAAAMLELYRARHLNPDDEEAAGLLDRMQRALASLQALLSSLLTYHKVLGSLEAQREEVPLGEVVAAAMANLQQAIDTAQAVVETHPLPRVTGNAGLLTLVFQNLIENALKYRRDGVPPRIQISSVSASSGLAVVAVRDNGRGFDPAHSREIFAPFARLHPDTGVQGAGIGLATCARIVERHDGRIWAESTEDAGSTFFVQLPCPVPVPARKEGGRGLRRIRPSARNG
jgi:signal transduction histidine kinase